MSQNRESAMYAAPTVRELGSLEEMTEKAKPPKQNKIGSSSDKFTQTTGLSGDIVPFP